MISCHLTDIPAVVGYREENVLLSCFDTSAIVLNTGYRVIWSKCAADGTQKKNILARPITPEIKDAERVKWEDNENGRILLTKLQQSDEGLYTCEVWQGWDRILVKNISLKIKGEFVYLTLILS